MIRSPSLFLKSLEIAGFKSFARPVLLEFPAGITAFVGPNGSGKSNIVDAVRWCLGEQSARDLRANRAEDVIYAGQRRVLGAAEVALTFESGPRDEVPWAELAIARRLYRSGESEYLLNGARARLRDIVSGLRTVGIDSGRNVIVTQGMADALLAATPVERRELLEQAAGLATYRERRDEARHKLTTTQENIQTIEAVLAEMEPRLRLLRRQSRAIQDRAEAQAALESKLEEWLASQWADFTWRLERASDEAAEASAARQGVARSVHRLEAMAEGALQQERAHRSELEGATAALHGSEREYDAHRHELRQLESQIESAERRRETIDRRHRRLDEERREARERIEALEQEVRRLVEERRAKSEDARAILAQRETAQARVSRLCGQATTTSNRLSECERRWTELETQRRAVQSEIDHDRHLARLTERRLAVADEELREATRKADAAREAAARFNDEHMRLATELSRCCAETDAARERDERLARLERKLCVIVHEVASRVSATKHAVESYDGDAAGLLAELASADEWDDALTAVLHAWMNVPSAALRPGDLEAIRQWRAGLAQSLGRARWADEVVGGLRNDVIHPLVTALFVDTDDEAESVWSSLADRPAFRVDTPPVVVVTRRGTVHDAAGVRSSQSDGRASLYLRNKRELARLERRRDRASGLLERITPVHAAATSHLNQCQETQASVERSLASTKSAHEDALARMDRARRRMGDLQREIAGCYETLDAHRFAIEHAERRAAELAHEAANIRVELEAAQRDQALVEREAKDAVQALADLEDRRRVLDHAVEALDLGHQVRQEALDQLRRGQERLEREAGNLVEESKSILTEIEHARVATEGRNGPVRDLEAVIAAQRKRIAELQARAPTTIPGEELVTARERFSAAVARHERALAALSQLTDERRQLVATIHLETGKDPEQLRSPSENPPTEEEIRKLRIRATQYAAADPSVVEESRQLGERHRYLREHLGDLQRAVETLREVMSIADREMRARFERAFRAVNEELARVYTRMLPGGEASLEQNPEGGVDIRVRLPGRRTRSSAAFSGGERALVASALLFGVLRIRPTPFCLLDEVDAALDESNIDRYLTVLREMAEKTQILLVTHNRATMAAADVLYGLTMDGEGVSSILSLKLETYSNSA